MKSISPLLFVSWAGILLLFLTSSPWMGSVGFLLFCTPVIRSIAHKLPKDVHTHRRILASILFFCGLSLLGTTIYYAHAITPTISTAMAALVSLIAAKQPRWKIRPLQRTFDPIVLLTIALQVAMIVMLFQARHGELMVSPWDFIAPSFFLLFFFSTIGTVYVAYKRSPGLTMLLVLQLFVYYAIASIMYKIGFGFDGFIHRATQHWIAEHGFIMPKQPYYIGQYALVVWLHHLTHIPLHHIDVFFVPVTTALSVPGVFLFATNTLKHHVVKAVGVLLLPFMYFITLNLTTPHNVVLLLFVLVILLLWKKAHWWITGILTLTAVATHPLLGAPLLLFFIVHVASETWPEKTTVLLSGYFIGMALLPAAMFTTNNVLAGAGWPTFSNPLSEIGAFFDLFTRPYWYLNWAGWKWELFYVLQLLIAPSVLALAVLGWERNKQQRLFALGFTSFLIAAWLLRSWIYFPGVAAAEQGNYPTRLIWSSMIFLLPAAITGLHRLYELLLPSMKKMRGINVCCLLAVGSALTVSLYFAYPQNNYKARYPGYNITAHDFAAVAYIQSLHDDDQFIVIANQLVGAAALTASSFNHTFQTTQGEVYYYSVPSGGPLYHYYGKMVYEGQKNEYMQQAMMLAGVDTAYFVINQYWGKYEEIVAQATKTADAVHVIGDGAVTILTYFRTPDDITE